MTTIAEFLNTSKGYSFQKEAKTSGDVSWGPLNPAWWSTPNPGQVRSGLKKVLTPEFFRNQMESYIKDNPQYASLSAYIMRDPGLFDALSAIGVDDVYNYYEDPSRKGDTNWAELQKQFDNGYVIPEELKNKFLQRVQNYFTNKWNDPNNQQYLYQLARRGMTDAEQAILDRQIKINPDLENRIGQLIAGRTQGLLDEGIENVLDPARQKQIYEELTPAIQDEILSNALQYMDMIPDSEVHPRMSEQEYLERNLFGNDPAFRGALDQYYDKDNPQSSNQVVFGLFNEFKNPNSPLRMAAINHYRHLPEEERKNSMLSRWIGTMSNFANDMGQARLRDDLDNINNGLSSTLGTYGKTFFGNETLDEEAGKRISPYWGKAENALKNSYIGQQWLDKWKNAKPNEANIGAQNKYVDDLLANRMEDNFYGWFKDPGVMKAMQYAMPFMSYGAPLAMAGSLMGTNALWPLMLLGGVGAAGLRYGMGNGSIGVNPETLAGWDKTMDSFNSPLSMISGLLPTGTQPAFKQLFNIKEQEPTTTGKSAPATPATTGTGKGMAPPAPKAPATSTTPPPPTTTSAYNFNNNPYNWKPPVNRTFTPTGNSRKPSWDWDPYNPAGVRHQELTEFA